MLYWIWVSEALGERAGKGKGPAPVPVRAPQRVLAVAARPHPFVLRSWTNRFERWPKIQTESVILSAASSNLPEPRGSAARAGGQQR